MSAPDLRRAFRSKASKDLYDQAVEAGWTGEKLNNGHIRVLSPDGTAFMVLSGTERDGPSNRKVKNNASILKRWLREQEKP